MEKLIAKFARHLAKSLNNTEEEFERINYMLLVYTYNILKTVGLIITFVITGYVKEGLLAMVIVLATKKYLIGYHEDTQIKCFIASLIFIYAAIYLGTTNTLNCTSLILINVLSLFCVEQQAPVEIIDEDEPTLTEEMKQIYRRKAIIIYIVFFIVFIILHKIKWIINIGTWMLLIQALLLFPKRQKK